MIARNRCTWMSANSYFRSLLAWISWCTQVKTRAMPAITTVQRPAVLFKNSIINYSFPMPTKNQQTPGGIGAHTDFISDTGTLEGGARCELLWNVRA